MDRKLSAELSVLLCMTTTTKNCCLIGPAATNRKSTIMNNDNEPHFCNNFSKHLDRKLAMLNWSGLIANCFIEIIVIV